MGRTARLSGGGVSERAAAPVGARLDGFPPASTRANPDRGPALPLAIVGDQAVGHCCGVQRVLDLVLLQRTCGTWHSNCSPRGMQPLEMVGLVLIAWCALSAVVAAGWSRFMSDLHRREPQTVPARRMPRRTHHRVMRAT